MEWHYYSPAWALHEHNRLELELELILALVLTLWPLLDQSKAEATFYPGLVLVNSPAI